MKKTGVLIVTALVCVSCTFIQESLPKAFSSYRLRFSDVSDLTGMQVGRYGMGYTTDGENLYAINGSSLTPSETPILTSDVLRYNTKSDEWTSVANGLTPKRYTSAEYIAGKIYIFNGVGLSGEINKKVEVLDLQSGQLNYLSDNPSPVSFSGTAVWEEKIYVFGGEANRKYYNQMYVFDPIADKWTLLGVIPEHKHTRGEIVDGVLYTFGGYKGEVSSKIHAYNIAKNEWYYLGNMVVGISANAITRHGRFIWLVGSYDRLSSLAVFDTKTRKIYLIKSNMYGRRHAAAEVIGDKLYVYGGNEASSESFISSIQVADLKEIESQLSQP